MNFSASHPAQIGKYKILKLLGGGATADVYLAQDTFLQTQVALKVFKQNLLKDAEYSSRVSRMFHNEAKLVRELHHPGIVAIHDAVQEHDHTYVVMEYVDGEPISSHCRPDNLLPIPTVLQIAFKCCMAMHYAAQHGLVHRDIKPDNLLLTAGGDIKISDFGTARQDNHALTALSNMMGTPAYMSPEQIWEKPLSFSSDIFSLGVVIYELLCGARPFHADNLMTLLYQIQNEPHKPLHSQRADIPPALEILLEIALQKDPEARFPSWQAFADHLSAIDQTLVTNNQNYSDREKFLALRHNPFFADFEEPEIWQVLHIASWHKLAAGTLLMQEDNQGNSFSVLLAGDAEVRKKGKLLFLLQSGDCVGEIAFIKPNQRTRSASVKAASKVLLVKFRRENIENASIDLRARFERRILQILVDRLQETTEKLALRS